ncbi:MAG: MotA/TolQ/ExbB proton channel family protein [Myxococcota bacterium]
MESFSFVEMWKTMGVLARAVVVILAIMSMYSLYVSGDRLMTFVRARGASITFVGGLASSLKAQNVKQALELAEAKPQPPIARVVQAGLREYVDGLEALRTSGPADVGDFDVVEAVNRAVERVKEREVADLRRGLGGLATIASAAPFVGLFGTVVGIINAFQSMAASGQGGLASVSAGIAEALVTTAFGLLVAIPAVMIFNYFTNRVDDFVVDMNDVSSELVTFVLKEGRK